jgi:hypothetical protein
MSEEEAEVEVESLGISTLASRGASLALPGAKISTVKP